MKGIKALRGIASASRLAFSLGLVEDGQVWMDMLESRNRTVHTYDARVLEQEFAKVQQAYAPALAALANTFQALP